MHHNDKNKSDDENNSGQKPGTIEANNTESQRPLINLQHPLSGAVLNIFRVFFQVIRRSPKITAAFILSFVGYLLISGYFAKRENVPIIAGKEFPLNQTNNPEIIKYLLSGKGMDILDTAGNRSLVASVAKGFGGSCEQKVQFNPFDDLGTNMATYLKPEYAAGGDALAMEGLKNLGDAFKIYADVVNQGIGALDDYQEKNALFRKDGIQDGIVISSFVGCAGKEANNFVSNVSEVIIKRAGTTPLLPRAEELGFAAKYCIDPKIEENILVCWNVVKGTEKLDMFYSMKISDNPNDPVHCSGVHKNYEDMLLNKHGVSRADLNVCKGIDLPIRREKNGEATWFEYK